MKQYLINNLSISLRTLGALIIVSSLLSGCALLKSSQKTNSIPSPKVSIHSVQKASACDTASVLMTNLKAHHRHYVLPNGQACAVVLHDNKDWVTHYAM